MSYIRFIKAKLTYFKQGVCFDNHARGKYLRLAYLLYGGIIISSVPQIECFQNYKRYSWKIYSNCKQFKTVKIA